MFGGISLPSRVFSSQSLMDGESLISSQKFDGDMTEEALLAELKMLEDMGIPTIKCIKSHCKTIMTWYCWIWFSDVPRSEWLWLYSPQDFKRSAMSRPVATPLRGGNAVETQEPQETVQSLETLEPDHGTQALPSPNPDQCDYVTLPCLEIDFF